MQTITYNNIYDTIKTIAASNREIQTFGWGEVWEIATSGTINYPYLWVVPSTSTIANGEVSYKFKFICMDLVDKAQNQLNDVHSDTHRILLDVFAKLKMGGYNLNIMSRSKNETITLESFNEKFDDEVAGWWGDITIWTDWDFNSCQIPT